MQIPIRNAAQNSKIDAGVFYGLNRADKGQNGEFQDMVNMSSDHYPCLSPRKPRETVCGIENIRAVIAPKYEDEKDKITSFTGVAGTTFYYDGQPVSCADDEMKIPESGSVTLCDFNGQIVICAYQDDEHHAMYCFNYAAKGDGLVHRMQKGRYNITCSAYSSGDPDTDAEVINYIDCGGINSITVSKAAGNKIYIKNSLTDAQKALMDEAIITAKDTNKNTLKYTAVSAGYDDTDKMYFIECKETIDSNSIKNNTVLKLDYWSGKFSVGSSVFFEGFENEENNPVNIDSKFEKTTERRIKSCTIERIDGSKLYLDMRNYLGARMVFKKPENNTITSSVSQKESGAVLDVYSKIPVMNHVCIHNNRLWGTNPNGEFIYASKLGDCFDFTSYKGLANDSYYAEIGTKGSFVGIASYRDNLVAFKRDFIHHIYGDKPSNYTIPKQLADCGCIDIRSVVEIGAVLYFLGYNGFYEYTGGQPAIISTALNAQYKSAVGMSDGMRYIVSAVRRDNGKTEMLSYDTRYGTWHKEDEFDAIGYFRWHNDLYISSKCEVKRCGYGDETIEWKAESVKLYENIFDDKGVNEIWIRALLDKDSKITVYTQVNGGEWIEHNTLLPQGLKVYRVPVRFKKDEIFRYMLQGTGAAVIYDIEYITYVGGRMYKAY